jgi:hypothetical protein
VKKYLIDEVEVTQQEYLYGADVIVPKIPAEVVEARIRLLECNLEKVLDHSFYVRDSRRCDQILKEIKFWYEINKGDIDE